MIFSYTKHTLISKFHFNITIVNYKTYVLLHLLGVTPMDGIRKVIDELGLIILSKEIEIESQQEQLEKLRKKIETLEKYISFYDEYYSHERVVEQ